MLIAGLLLAGCAPAPEPVSRTPQTRCEKILSALSNPWMTEGQIAALLETGRNEGCFGMPQPQPTTQQSPTVYEMSEVLTTAPAGYSLVSQNDDLAYFLNAESIRRNGRYRVAWILANSSSPSYTSGKPYYSTALYSRFDCEGQSSGILKLVAYSKLGGLGSVVLSYTPDDTPLMSRSVPGSLGEGTLQYVCAVELR